MKYYLLYRNSERDRFKRRCFLSFYSVVLNHIFSYTITLRIMFALKKLPVYSDSF